MRKLLTTDSVAVDDRVDWWRDSTTTLFGAEYAIEPDKHQTFRIHMDVLATKSLPFVLLDASTSAHMAAQCEGGAAADNIVIHLQLQGHCNVYGEGKKATIKAGEIAFHRTGAANTLQFYEDNRSICVIVPASVLAPEVTDWLPLVNEIIPTNVGVAALLADHLRSLVAHVSGLGKADLIELSSFTLGLSRAALCTQAGSSKLPSKLRAYHVERIKQFVIDNLQYPALNIEFIASGVNLSERYIHQIFADEPLSLMRWVMQKRLEYAYDQLRQPGCSQSISQIAYIWGFADHAHFSRNFKRHFGLSPREVLAG